MIHVTAPAEPPGFHSQCREPGNRWLAGHPDGDPHDKPLWTEFRPALRDGFGKLCGYLAMRIPKGTVDHWLSTKSRRDLAYEWTNYRFVDHAVNSAKKPSWEGRLLDPFEVGDDWFEILLPSLQLVPTDNIPREARGRAAFTIEKLGLRDGEDVIQLRREWMELFEAGELTLDGLGRVAPLLARAIERRDAATHQVPRPE